MAESESENQSRNFFTPKIYDRLKFVAQILLPALGSLYFAIGGIWNLERTTEVVGTITAVDLFLGLVLQLSSNRYYKNDNNFDGELKMVSDEEGREKVVFDVRSDPETVVKQFGKRTFEFKVNRNS